MSSDGLGGAAVVVQGATRIDGQVHIGGYWPLPPVVRSQKGIDRTLEVERSVIVDVDSRRHRQSAKRRTVWKVHCAVVCLRQIDVLGNVPGTSKGLYTRKSNGTGTHKVNGPTTLYRIGRHIKTLESLVGGTFPVKVCVSGNRQGAVRVERTGSADFQRTGIYCGVACIGVVAGQSQLSITRLCEGATCTAESGSVGDVLSISVNGISLIIRLAEPARIIRGIAGPMAQGAATESDYSAGANRIRLTQFQNSAID